MERMDVILNHFLSTKGAPRGEIEPANLHHTSLHFLCSVYTRLPTSYNYPLLQICLNFHLSDLLRQTMIKMQVKRAEVYATDFEVLFFLPLVMWTMFIHALLIIFMQIMWEQNVTVTTQGSAFSPGLSSWRQRIRRKRIPWTGQ